MALVFRAACAVCKIYDCRNKAGIAVEWNKWTARILRRLKNGSIGLFKIKPSIQLRRHAPFQSIGKDSCDIGERLIGLGEDARGRRREDGWRKSESGDDGSNGQENSHGDGDELYC